MLTDVKIRTAKPADKPYRLADAGGLYVWVTPAGGKIWRLRYEVAGREKLISFGPYPAVSLVEARAKREDAKAQLREGLDPALERKLKRAAGELAVQNDFKSVALAWHARQISVWSPRHADDVLDSLNKYVFPAMGSLPVAQIETPAVVNILQAIEAAGAPETARRVRQRISAIFIHAVALGLAKNDPAHLARGALKPVKKKRQPAIVQLEPLRDMMRMAESIPAHFVSRLALRFLALTAVRPGELRGARWDELKGLDGHAPVWEIPAERMKMKVDHAVPLSRQALEIIDVVRPLTGRHPFIFPSARHAHRPMSENALGYLLNRAGYHGRHVPHGFRASFSSIMNEKYRQDRQIIDLMLAHAPQNEVEGAYNRATHFERRAELAQVWADLLLDGFMPTRDLLNLPQK